MKVAVHKVHIEVSGSLAKRLGEISKFKMFNPKLFNLKEYNPTWTLNKYDEYKLYAYITHNKFKEKLK